MLSITTRPQKYSEVIGQELAVTTLKKIAQAEKTPTHSIVLQGSYGCGKSTLARIFAKSVNCPTFKKTGEVCDECEHCLSVKAGTSPYYQEYDSTRVGNVDSVKALIESLSFKVTENHLRVIMLDEIHAASPQALTALLKTIEEGVPNTTFVFCTTESLMKTIMSRSTVIPISTIPHPKLTAHVKAVALTQNIIITDAQIETLVYKSAHHVRDAMQLLDFFAISGEKALDTPYKVISDIILAVLKKQPIDEPLKELILYPVNTIAPTIAQFLINCFQGKGDFETKIKDTGIAKKLFNHFYSPQVRNALQDEYGIILTFQTLVN